MTVDVQDCAAGVGTVPKARLRKLRPSSEHSQESPSPQMPAVTVVSAMGSQKGRPPSARRAANSKSREPAHCSRLAHRSNFFVMGMPSLIFVGFSIPQKLYDKPDFCAKGAQGVATHEKKE